MEDGLFRLDVDKEYYCGNVFSRQMYLAYNIYKIWTKYKNLSKKQRIVSFVNDLGFSLCTALSTCYMVTTLESWSKVQEINKTSILL